MLSNPGGGEILCTLPDWHWGPHSLLKDGYRVCFPGGKRPECGVHHPTTSGAGVIERIQLYFYWGFIARYRVNFNIFTNSLLGTL